MDVETMTEDQAIAELRKAMAAMKRDYTPREKFDRKLPMTDAEWAALPNHVRNRNDREKYRAKPAAVVAVATPAKVNPILPDVDPVDFPIDLVYLWCDGSDPAFVAEAKAHGIQSRSGSRFADCGELRYSLRSVERFAPWIRMIHIVTNGQVPAWLRRDHPKIRLVTHRDIFAWPEHLPTFNSVAIEQHIHRIPGLAEHFLFANDDCLFGCPVQPGHFFTSDGKAKLGMAGLLSGDNAYTQTLTNAAEVLAKHFGPKQYRRAIHQIQPLRKSALAEIVERCPEVSRQNSASRTRRRTNVALNAALWPEWMLNTGRAIAVRISSHYVNANRLDGASRLPVGHPLICVNNSTPAVAGQVRSYLSLLLPDPSSFEAQRTIAVHSCFSTNFGDSLSVPILQHFLPDAKIEPVKPSRRGKIVAVGSTINRARPGDVVWGTGSISPSVRVRSGLRILAVRGKLTRELAVAAGNECPEVYGDPALLLPMIYTPKPGLRRFDVGYVPHYVDFEQVRERFGHLHDVCVIDVRQPWRAVVDQIAACDRIVSSSLHGIVAAEAYGIPAEWAVYSDRVEGGAHKFHDYLTGTGRTIQGPGPLPPINGIESIRRGLLDAIQPIAAG